MNTIFYNPTVRGLLSLWLLFVCLTLVWAVMRLLQQKRYKVLLPTLAVFAGCDIYWQYLNAYSYYIGSNKEYYKIDYAPIWIIAAANLILTVAAAAITLHISKWQKTHICAVSIKEGLDTLPSGVCFYESGGRIYLVNDAMDRITQLLIGRHLFNGEILWNILKEKSAPIDDENKAIVEIGDKSYGFTRYLNNIKGQELFEIIAADITEEAVQNRLLEQRNKDLEELNRRLDEYNANLEGIVREREILQSKARIHDDMNVLLISTVNSVEHYEKGETQRISELWNSNILALERDTEPYRKNPLESLQALANSLGIALEFVGEFPAENENIRLLITAVSECMINALRHANATTLFVSSRADGFVIKNDGLKPKVEIIEGGGLTNLRRRANKANAALKICSTPEFSVTVIYGKGDGNDKGINC